MKSSLGVLVLACHLLACGGEEAPANGADAARREAVERLKRGAEEALLRADALAAEGKTEEAWAAWREARDLVGETPELARYGEAIRAAERRQRHRADWMRLRGLMNRAPGSTPETEISQLTETVGAAETFLTAFPDSAHLEEARAGLEYAKGELSRREEYSAALAEADGHVAAERWAEAAAAARRAQDLGASEKPRKILLRALGALAPEGMVFIPDGIFPAGGAKEPTYVAAFYIDRTEVTNARYAVFVAASGHEAPAHFQDGRPGSGAEEKPVTGVTLDDALAFAAWAGNRLPTEREWERAARGTEGRAYPWGDEWDPGKGHFGSGGPREVGSMPMDASPDGVLDMGGNVMEMTLPLPVPDEEKPGPVLKGGHWSDDFHAEYALAAARYAVERDHRGPTSGFRCARDIGE